MNTFEDFVDSFDKRDRIKIQCPILYSRTKDYTWEVSFCIATNNGKEFNFDGIENIIYANIPDGSIFRYYITYGQENKVITVREVLSGKNIGKKNETSLLIQGLKDIYSLYKKKLETYSLEKASNVKITSIDDLYKNRKNVMVYGMNMYKYEGKISKFPVIVQPKLNGMFCCIVWHKLSNICITYTRQLKELVNSTSHIKEEFKRNIGIHDTYFTGELYIPGKNLQDIISIARSDKADANITNSTTLQLHIFDYFIIGDTTNAEDRQTRLREIVHDGPFIKLVESVYANSLAEIDKLKNKFINRGEEGAVIRLPNKVYEYGINRPIRSRSILKYKNLYEGVFPLVGYNNDAYDGIIFICAQSKELNSSSLNERLTFSVVPNWPTDIRRLAYKRMTDDLFRKKYYGHMVNIYYNDLSKDKIPLQGKMEIFVEQDLYDDLVLNIK